MRILVDEMPKKNYKCPYCLDNSTMDYEEYKCQWQNSGIDCWDVKDCPFFMDASEYIESVVVDRFGIETTETRHNNYSDW